MPGGDPPDCSHIGLQYWTGFVLPCQILEGIDEADPEYETKKRALCQMIRALWDSYQAKHVGRLRECRLDGHPDTPGTEGPPMWGVPPNNLNECEACN